jgi:hypothetical protein
MKYSVSLLKPYDKHCWELRVGIREGTGFIPLKITVEKLPIVAEGMLLDRGNNINLFDHELIQLKDAFLEALEMAGIMQNVTATQAELKATKYHLEDMRKLGLR